MPTRAQQDAALQVTANFPNNNSTVNTNALDLGQVNAFPVNESMAVVISTTAGTNAANNKNITFHLQHANVNLAANFSNVAGGGPYYIPEVGAQYAATNINVAIPPDAKQFLRVQIKCENLGGNANDGTATVKLQF